jgi:basic membrane protein A
LILAAFMLALAVSCGGSSTPAQSGKLKVGLVLFGSATDGGWSQMAKDALDKMAGPENLEVRVQQNVTEDKAADAIRQFDAEGFQLIIGHGHEALNAAKELTDPAKGNPVKAKLVVSGVGESNGNFQALDFDLAGASYQLGIIAGKVTKSGKLGFIGGDKSPAVQAMQRGFMAGAKSVNPNATFSDAWPGWDDPGAAKKAAEAFIAQGVDVIMQNVDSASRGVFEAVKEYNGSEDKPHAPVYTFGANSDQNGNAICGDYTLASAVIKMDLAFAPAIKAAKDGTFKGGVVSENLNNGVCAAVLNPKLTGKVINAETQKLVEDAAKKIASGEVTIPKE